MSERRGGRRQKRTKTRGHRRAVSLGKMESPFSVPDDTTKNESEESKETTEDACRDLSRPDSFRAQTNRRGDGERLFPSRVGSVSREITEIG